MSWAVAWTKPAAEQLAVRSVIEGGTRAYCPMLRVVLRGNRPGKGGAVQRPLFPRYVFVELDEGRFVAQRYAKGVVDLIRGSNQRPSLIADEIVEELRSRERDGEFDAAATTHWKPGQMVTVESEWGIMPAKLLEMSGAGRVTVLMTLLNREVRSNVGVDKLRAAG